MPATANTGTPAQVGRWRLDPSRGRENATGDAETPVERRRAIRRGGARIRRPSAPSPARASAAAAAASGSRRRPAGSDAIGQIALVDQQQIDIARQRRRAETHRPADGRWRRTRARRGGRRESGRRRPAPARRAARAPASAASSPAVSTSARTLRAVRHDRDAVARRPAGVAAREDRRALAALEQQPREMRRRPASCRCRRRAGCRR